jgi:hypothetical protein
MSLFDTIMNEGDSNANDNVQHDAISEQSESEHNQPTWWWDKGTPGEGERPEWLPDKYKSAEDVAKAYKELEKKFGTAPDEYDWSKGESWIDVEYEPFQVLADVAKTKNIPQDFMDVVLESVGKYLDEFSINIEEEKAQLGENAQERLRVLGNWAKANFSEDTYQALIGNMRTASAVKAIEEMRAKMLENNTHIPTGNEIAEPGFSKADIDAELEQNLQKYKDDPQYRKEIRAKYEKALSRK